MTVMQEFVMPSAFVLVLAVDTTSRAYRAGGLFGKMLLVFFAIVLWLKFRAWMRK
jgi:hypothetical protein